MQAIALLLCMVLGPLVAVIIYAGLLARFALVSIISYLWGDGFTAVAIAVVLCAKTRCAGGIALAIVFVLLSLPNVYDQYVGGRAARTYWMRVVLNMGSPGNVLAAIHVISFGWPQGQWELLSIGYLVVALFFESPHWRPGLRCSAASYVSALPLLVHYPMHLHAALCLVVTSWPHLPNSLDDLYGDTLPPDVDEDFDERFPSSQAAIDVEIGLLVEAGAIDEASRSSTLPRETPAGGCLFERGAAQITGGQHQDVPPDEQCLYHCIAAALDVRHYKALSGERKLEAAYFVKSMIMQWLLKQGMTTVYKRLSGRGPTSYPEDHDLFHAARCMGCAISLSWECWPSQLWE